MYGFTSLKNLEPLAHFLLSYENQQRILIDADPRIVKINCATLENLSRLCTSCADSHRTILDQPQSTHLAQKLIENKNRNIVSPKFAFYD